MRVSAALADVHRLAIDSAPLIYLVEKRPVYFERMIAIVLTILLLDELKVD
jgi:hypothetical protein